MQKCLELESYSGGKYSDKKFIVHCRVPAVRRSINRVQLLYYYNLLNSVDHTELIWKGF